MLIVMYSLFMISFLFLLGVVYHLIVLNRSGIFPSRIILKQRAGMMAVGAAIFLLLAVLTFLIT